MSMFLSGRSAIEYLKLHGTYESPAPHAREFKASVPTRQEARQALAGSLLGMAEPLEVLSPGGSTARGAHNDPQLTRRHWSCCLPTKAFIPIDEGARIFTSTPEFAFAQAANRLTLIELIAFGCEICGTYFISEQTPAGFYPCDSISTPEHLLRVLEKVPRFGGRRNALRSVRYVVAGSASPQETRLVLVLCLPCCLGGYGLPFPEMNYPVTPREGDTRFTSQSRFVCDLFWRSARLDVEYDSDQFHAGADELARDARRRSELALLGVQVISVTSRQLGSWHETEKVAHAIARTLGVQLRCVRTPDWASRHAALRRELFSDLRAPGNQ